MDDVLATIYTAHVTLQKLRYDRALSDAGFDHLAIFSGQLHYQFLDDNAYPYKPNPHFKSWVPVTDNPNCWILYTPGHKPRLLFWQPVDYWYKPAPTPSDHWTDKFEIVLIADPDDAKQHMPKGKTCFIGEWDERFASWGDFTANPDKVLNSIHFDRGWKTEYEIECLRRANERGARGHLVAEQSFRDGNSEFEIHLDYLRGADSAEEEVPYGNIIAINENASTLHYLGHDRRRIPEKERWSFLIDAGASYNGYACDITRTWSSRKDEFQELIGAMDAMQRGLVDMIKPHVNYIDVHFAAHRGVADILVRFKFVRDIDAAGVVEKRISNVFFPHGVGHYLGLQVHDVGGFMGDRCTAIIDKPEGHPFLRLTRVVEPGMVFTIEPGMYFIDSLLADLRKTENAKFVDWDKVEKFRKFGGIRIEDDIVVTEIGHENMTRDAFARVV